MGFIGKFELPNLHADYLLKTVRTRYVRNFKKSVKDCRTNTRAEGEMKIDAKTPQEISLYSQSHISWHGIFPFPARREDLTLSIYLAGIVNKLLTKCGRRCKTLHKLGNYMVSTVSAGSVAVWQEQLLQHIVNVFKQQYLLFNYTILKCDRVSNYTLNKKNYNKTSIAI